MEEMKMKNNEFFLDGFMLKNPELLTSKDGKSYCKGSVSVRTGKKNEEGYYDSYIFYFTAFDQTAEYMARECGKGTRVNLWGALKKSSYTIQEAETDAHGNISARSKTINSVELIVRDVSVTRKAQKKDDSEEEKKDNQEENNVPEKVEGIEPYTEEANPEPEEEMSEEEWYELNKATPETVPGLVGYDDDDNNWT